MNKISVIIFLVICPFFLRSFITRSNFGLSSLNRITYKDSLSKLCLSIYTAPSKSSVVEPILANRDSWAFATNEVHEGTFSQTFRLTFSQAWKSLGSSLPDVCIVHYSPGLVEKSSDQNYTRVFNHILSNFPSIQTVVGLAIDNPKHEKSVSVSLASLPGKTISAFHFDKIPDREPLHVSDNFLGRSYGATADRSFLFFPHPSIGMQPMMEMVDNLMDLYPSSTVIGELLSSNLPLYAPAGFLLERGFPNSTATLMKTGVIGLALSTNSALSLKHIWPSWMQSLVPTLRWAHVLGH